MLGYADGSEAHRQGVERVVNVMQEWNRANLGTVELREQDLLLLSVLGITVD